MTERNELQELLFTVAQAEAMTGRVVACRRPHSALYPEMCRGCPVWGTCRGFGVRYPGMFGTDGGQVDPVRDDKADWRNRISRINKEDTR